MDCTHEAASQDEPKFASLNRYAHNFQIPTIEITTEPEEIEYTSDRIESASFGLVSVGTPRVGGPRRCTKDTRLAPERHDDIQDPNLTRVAFGERTRQQPDADVVAEE